MERDRFFSAEQAVEYGLVDRIMSASELHRRTVGLRGRVAAGRVEHSGCACCPLLLVAALLVGCDSGGESKPAPEPLAPAGDHRAELGEHLSALQRDRRPERRDTRGGHAGLQRVRGLRGKRLRGAGWRVRLQPFRFAYFELKHAAMSIGGRSCGEARDFQVLSYSGAGRASGPLRRLAVTAARPTSSPA